MNRHFFVLLSVCLCVSFIISPTFSVAQKYGKLDIHDISHEVSKGNKNIIRVEVIDSVNNTPLNGATIKIGNNKDSSIVASGEYTYINYPYTDSVNIVVRYMGYNTFISSIKVTPPVSLKILMSKKEVEIAELVVKGMSLAYVLDKDTITFNANAYKTMDGSSFKVTYVISRNRNHRWNYYF